MFLVNFVPYAFQNKHRLFS